MPAHQQPAADDRKHAKRRQITRGAGEEAAETILEAQSAFDRPWPDVTDGAKTSPGARIGADMKIVSVGAASRDGRLGVRVPLVLGNDEGETVTLNLKIQLEPLLDDELT